MVKVIYNDIIPFSGFKAITILPFVFARTKTRPLDDKTLNHESIHLRQQLEVLVAAAVLMAVLCLTCLSWWWMCAAPIAYYAWYCLEYVIRLFAYGRGTRPTTTSASSRRPSSMRATSTTCRRTAGPSHG